MWILAFEKLENIWYRLPSKANTDKNYIVSCKQVGWVIVDLSWECIILWRLFLFLLNFFPLKFTFVMDKQATESIKGTKPNSIVCADCDGNGKFVILFFFLLFVGSIFEFEIRCLSFCAEFCLEHTLEYQI